MLKRVDIAVYDAFTAGADIEPGIAALGVKEDGVGYAMDDNNAPLVTPEMLTAVEAARAGIADGSIMVHDYMSDETCPALTF
jgi:basic membrane protein A